MRRNREIEWRPRLEDLRALGYKVFHDIPGEGAGGRFDVDHALVGPGGVFAIETKTFSEPIGRDAKVEYDGHRIQIDGDAPDRDPIAQAQAAADHIRGILQRMTGRDVSVRPVVLFPGWYITRQPKRCRTWVLNPKALASFLANESPQLSPEDVAVFTERLTLHLETA